MEVINNPVFWAVALGFFLAWEFSEQINALGQRMAAWIWRLGGLG